MTKKRTFLWWVICLCLLLAVNFAPKAASALLQPAVAAIQWWTIGSGGGPASGSGGVVINATMGQPVVGSSSTQNAVTLQAGYWQPDETVLVYLPLLRK